MKQKNWDLLQRKYESLQKNKSEDKQGKLKTMEKESFKNRDFSNLTIDYFNFSDCDLTGSKFNGTIFVGSDLREATGTPLEVIKCKFVWCDLRGVTWNIPLVDCSFYSCELHNFEVQYKKEVVCFGDNSAEQITTLPYAKENGIEKILK